MGSGNELKDLILQTLDEVAQAPNQTTDSNASNTPESKPTSTRTTHKKSAQPDSTTQADSTRTTSACATQTSTQRKLPKTSIESSPTKDGKIIPPDEQEYSTNDEYRVFVEDLREKLLVLFEGLQMPHLQDSQNKLDLVIHFLQYQLCVIDEMLEKK